MDIFLFILASGLIALMIVAAIGDVKRLIIPNKLCLAVALLALPYIGLLIWSGGPALTVLASHFGIALVIFIVGLGFFSLGIMGGGDVKLTTALALWAGTASIIPVLLVISIAGGVVGIATFLHRRKSKYRNASKTADDSAENGMPDVPDDIAKARDKLHVPYGVAIAIGGIFFSGQLILNGWAA